MSASSGNESWSAWYQYSHAPCAPARPASAPFRREPLSQPADQSAVATVRLLQAMYLGLSVLGREADKQLPQGAKSPGASIHPLPVHLPIACVIGSSRSGIAAASDAAVAALHSCIGTDRKCPCKVWCKAVRRAWNCEVLP